ncbi:hypothetical protein [Arabidopsis thaliana]|uniref:F-box associated ubiquitination effector family protein n=1 Tax=Arabidopsis thaliana TaxID=3702 RepID=Q9C628_ARATH|nr:F-box associated ubiquitination effector family protein [Arabidopsis thaliana]AAG50622.1 hypothetical protein [Arabidopsis thaliana]AEE32131.1 F-box associated ubiquitination effector family protein [Arabidopsis thaliana]|eukprot:NP_175149.1 F-box associated ubiquitination effector family protein [Arabidopsis thaliana]
MSLCVETMGFHTSTSRFCGIVPHKVIVTAASFVHLQKWQQVVLLLIPSTSNFWKELKCCSKRVSYGLFWKLDITSPKVGTGNVILKCFFGYDPIRKQFKVLCWTNFYRQGRTSNEQYQVLTLGTGELLWRKIECLFPHEPHKDKNGICINGVLYYIAWLKNRCYDGTEIIVCFDVRSEKFSFIEIEIKEVKGSILLEYKGKLGVLMWSVYSYSAELWVLDDTKNVKWSKYKFVLPYTASEEVKKSIWATDSGELVWTLSSPLSHPLYVYYYNLESQSVREVEIKGMKDKVSRDIGNSLVTFTNYVENLMFLQ